VLGNAHPKAAFPVLSSKHSASICFSEEPLGIVIHRDSELCPLLAAANFSLVANLHLATAAPQFYAMVADIQSMGQMTCLTPCDSEAHRRDRFRSFRPLFYIVK
jgi:hypothetical protein